MSWLCFPSAWPCLLISILLSKHGAAHPSWFLFYCALPKLYKFTRLLDLRALRVILGAVICIYMRWRSGYENGLVVFGTQPGCKPCSVIFKMSIVVIVWPLGSKTRQTSRIRRNSDNWVVLGHTPKLPKIIDRRNVQVYIYIYYVYIYIYMRI